jgi:hypothetical protein
MENKGVCIDISNVIPGKRETKGDVATYAINLIKNFGQSNLAKSNEVICLKNIGLTRLDHCGFYMFIMKLVALQYLFKTPNESFMF